LKKRDWPGETGEERLRRDRRGETEEKRVRRRG
jgi:hypothetical protein